MKLIKYWNLESSFVLEFASVLELIKVNYPFVSWVLYSVFAEIVAGFLKTYESNVLDQ
jgi:hypothetical protein